MLWNGRVSCSMLPLQDLQLSYPTTVTKQDRREAGCLISLFACNGGQHCLLAGRLAAANQRRSLAVTHGSVHQLQWLNGWLLATCSPYEGTRQGPREQYCCSFTSDKHYWHVDLKLVEEGVEMCCQLARIPWQQHHIFRPCCGRFLQLRAPTDVHPAIVYLCLPRGRRLHDKYLRKWLTYGRTPFPRINILFLYAQGENMCSSALARLVWIICLTPHKGSCAG